MTAPHASASTGTTVTGPNDAVIAEFRANAGSVTHAMGGALASLELVLLHHVGRTSGKAYITPVSYMSHDDHFLALGSFAGAIAEPQWVENLVRATELSVEFPDGTRTMRPEVLRSGPERDRLYEIIREHWPFVLYYEQQTSRSFPVIRLTPLS